MDEIFTMSVTAKKACANGRLDVTLTGAWCPMTPTPIMVMKMATRIEIKDTTLRYEIPSSVRGIVRTKQMRAETPAQSTEHDAPEVIVSKAIRPVKTCEPQMKTRKMTWAAPSTSRPIGPARM